jgi:hypothetical protein
LNFQLKLQHRSALIISKIGKPEIARKCNPIVEFFASCQSYHSGIMVEAIIPRNKHHHQSRKIRLKSPAPPKALPFSAMSCASYKSLSDILAGCQLS